jgi:hypothetical protein
VAAAVAAVLLLLLLAALSVTHMLLLTEPFSHFICSGACAVQQVQRSIKHVRALRGPCALFRGIGRSAAWMQPPS